MKRLNLILNGKGGVGKSFFAVNFVQYLKDKAIPHAVFDSDNENSTLTRFHPEAAFVKLDEPQGPDALFTALEKSSLVVMDCRAASTDALIDHFALINLSTVLNTLGATLTLIMPVNHESDSVDQVQRLTDEFGKKCDYVVVRNAAHSKRFELFDGSEVRAKITGEFGGQVINMPQLQDWLVVALSSQDLTISATVKHPSISLLDRQRLQTWQHELYREIDSATNLLLPTP